MAVTKRTDRARHAFPATISAVETSVAPESSTILGGGNPIAVVNPHRPHQGNLVLIPRSFHTKSGKEIWRANSLNLLS